MAPEADSNTFAGYQRTEEGNLLKQCRVTWARSDWVHLNELCVRDGVVLEHRLTDDNYLLTFTLDNEMTVSVFDSSAAYRLCKQRKNSAFAELWKEKDWQGRVVREAREIDHRLSNAYLNNVNLRDSLISFVIRGRLQLLQCNSLMSLYYPNECSQRCTLCNFPTETVSHILNGCAKYQLLYQARHNRVVDVVTSYIPAGVSLVVIKDTCLTPSLFGSDAEAFRTTATRPDITIINQSSREVFLVEIAVPFDAFIDVCYASKFDKYLPLCLEINAFGYACRTLVLIIGSLGNVHRRVVSGLKLAGMCNRSARWLAKYLSVSVMIGSSRVWQKRCSDLQV